MKKPVLETETETSDPKPAKQAKMPPAISRRFAKMQESLNGLREANIGLRQRVVKLETLFEDVQRLKSARKDHEASLRKASDRMEKFDALGLRVEHLKGRVRLLEDRERNREKREQEALEELALTYERSAEACAEGGGGAGELEEA